MKSKWLNGLLEKDPSPRPSRKPPAAMDLRSARRLSPGCYQMDFDLINEQDKLDACDRAINNAFEDPDLYFRNFFFEKLLLIKWVRVSILQSGVL
jgi:hypothetical protein